MFTTATASPRLTVKSSESTESEAPPSNSSSHPSCSSPSGSETLPGPAGSDQSGPRTGNPAWTDALGLFPDRRRKIPLVIVVFT